MPIDISLRVAPGIDPHTHKLISTGQVDTKFGFDVGSCAALGAIRRVKETLRPVEIAPQNAFVRRLQHQLVTENDLVARSTGKEPQRRLRILPSADAE